ncbi:hypothetical protein PS691_03201 [Pseudomonas fluorescens]|uniref:Uncharacterized protein n=1 Tax=Pseudomonas fluorescens TaxID=294 RepID=A0A5E7D9B5_PSEFL|nr:hypothetical protein [Pseudomonas fluorescens]VVO08385.1 hypothetical protein PS691_03201 [Pseudomonas fluorescens]
MRVRGSEYWAWADCQLAGKSHQESLSNGVEIDVQARLSPSGATQLFIGVYAQSGEIAAEEFYPLVHDETVTSALAWGAQRARAIAIGALTPIRPTV